LYSWRSRWFIVYLGTLCGAEKDGGNVTAQSEESYEKK